MKTQTTNPLSPLTKTEVENLTMQVKETLAIGFTSRHTKTFSTADLWNIHRNQRTIMSRRRYI